MRRPRKPNEDRSLSSAPHLGIHAPKLKFRPTKLILIDSLLIWQTPFFSFYFNSSIVNIQCYIGFRPMIQWFNNSIHHPVLIMTNAFLNPLHLFYPPTPISPLVTISLFSIIKSLFDGWSPFFPFVCFLNSTYEWNYMVFLFLLFPLALYSLAPSMSLQIARFHCLMAE